MLLCVSATSGSGSCAAAAEPDITTRLTEAENDLKENIARIDSLDKAAKTAPAGDNPLTVSVRDVLEQTRVALTQYIGLLQKELERKALQEADRLTPEKAIEDLKKGVSETSFVYLGRLERQLYQLDGRLQDAALVVASTQQLLLDDRASLQAAEQELRRLQAEASVDENTYYPGLALVEARVRLYQALTAYRQSLLDAQRQEISRDEQLRELVRQEHARVAPLVQFAEADREVSLEQFRERTAAVRARSDRAEATLTRLEKQAARQLRSGGTAAVLVYQNIQEAREVLQQAILSAVQLSDQHKQFLTIKFDYAAGTLTESGLQKRRRELVTTLEQTEEVLAWKERKFSLLVNQLIRVQGMEARDLQVELEKALQDITAIIGEQREGVRFLQWSIQRFLSQSGAGFGVSEGLSQAGEILLQFWYFEILVIDDNPITVSKIIRSLLIFLLGWFASRYITRKLLGRLFQRFPLRSGVAAAVQAISFYLLLACFGLLALHLVHIPLTVFTLLGGALAIGIGFGSQNILNNFISGLILLVEQPIRVGDIIEFTGMRGTVRGIGARSTLLLTPENLEVIVPNSQLLENAVTNWTLSSSVIRTSIFVGVAYGSPTRDVSKLLLKSVSEHGRVLKKPAPEVFFKDFGDNALTFELRFWMTMQRFGDALRIQSDIRHLIDQLFKDAAIVIAFPQRDVHFDTHGKPLQIEIVRQSGNVAVQPDDEKEKNDVISSKS